MPPEVAPAVAPDGLDGLFSPSAVAVVGASDNPAKIGGRPIHYLRTLGYAGRIHPINPTRSTVQGLPSLPSLAALPKPAELVLIAVPAELVAATVAESAAAGARFAVVFSAGFAETGVAGRRLEVELAALARHHGVRLCGPNSLGVISEPSRLTATFAGSLERPDPLLPGTVALVSQSGALGAFVYSLALEQGFGIRHFVSVGNEADLQVADYIRHFAADPGTETIIGYLEGIRDGDAFLAAVAEARRRGKAVAMIKVGRSEAARTAALTHTAAMAGDDSIYDAVFREAGIVRLEGVQELLDFARLRTTYPRRPKGRAVTVATISGGAGVWVADAFARLDVELSVLSASTLEHVAAVLPAFASGSNPIDFTPQVINRPGMLTGCLRELVKDPATGSLLVVMGLQEKTGVSLAREIAAAAEGTDKLVAVTWLVGPQEALAILEAACIPVFTDLARGVKAMGALIADTAAPAAIVDVLGGALPAPRTLPERADECDAKRLLEKVGVRVPRGDRAASPAAAAVIAHAIGFPVAVKVLASDVRHKTEARLLRLGVADDAQLLAAYHELAEAARRLLDGQPLQVLVEEMIPEGVEIAVAVNRDPVFGPVVSCGLGGVLVELSGGLALRHGRLAAPRALELAREGAVGRLLAGYRGRPAADVDAVADVLVAISELALANRDQLLALEINPLIVLPPGEGAVAADVLLITGPEARG